MHPSALVLHLVCRDRTRFRYHGDMEREVLETDEEGNPTVTIWKLTKMDIEDHMLALLEQKQRGIEVAKSLGIKPD